MITRNEYTHVEVLMEILAGAHYPNPTTEREIGYNEALTDISNVLRHNLPRINLAEYQPNQDAVEQCAAEAAAEAAELNRLYEAAEEEDLEEIYETHIPDDYVGGYGYAEQQEEDGTDESMVDAFAAYLAEEDAEKERMFTDAQLDVAKNGFAVWFDEVYNIGECSSSEANSEQAYDEYDYEVGGRV